MPDLPGPRIRRVAPGRYELTVPDDERAVIAGLLPQLRELLAVDDPSLRRLFPTAYAQDAERDREYQALVHDELLESRLAALEIVETTLGAEELDAEQLEGWLEALNSLRLVLGTRLDVSEELPDLDLDDPDAPAYAVYEYLGWMLDQAVHAAMGDL